MTDVSVIVCTRDRPGLAYDTVESILAGELTPAEIVIVDQSRYPDPRLANRGAPLQYVWTQTRGLCRARNIGVERARGSVIAFSDDDVFVDRGWLHALVGAIGEQDDRTVAAHDSTELWLRRIGLPFDELYCSDDKISRCVALEIDLLIDKLKSALTETESWLAGQKQVRVA